MKKPTVMECIKNFNRAKVKKKNTRGKDQAANNDVIREKMRRDVGSKSDSSFKNMQYEFISSMSHQMRTPVASIQSSLEVLELYIRKENRARQVQTLNKIKKSLAGLVDSLERITRLYKHEVIKQKLKKTKIEPHKFFNDLLDEVIADSENKHYININIDSAINNFLADEFVLKQILINLLANAIKFSPEGGQIQLSVINNKKNFEISIKDEGVGIDKKDLNKLFQPFFRGGNAVTIPGDGLGLAIVKKLCDLHKIKIECFSRLNSGTEFKLNIPQ